MLWVKESIEQLLSKLHTNLDTGLTKEQVKQKHAEFGTNEFEEGKKESLLQKIGHHLVEITTIVLLFAAAISAYLAITTGYGWAKVVVILGIVVLNMVLGIYQENSAEKALAALQSMNAHLTTVIRDGVRMQVDATELVPGDIIEIVAGDMIPADARIISSSSLQVEESALTGESVPVEKTQMRLFQKKHQLATV